MLADSVSPMSTYHLPEDHLLAHLQDFEHVYIEKSAAPLTEATSMCSKQLALLLDLINPAITQAQLVFKQLQSLSQPLDPEQFSYKQVKPLYIQNASITIKRQSTGKLAMPTTTQNTSIQQDNR